MNSSLKGALSFMTPLDVPLNVSLEEVQPIASFTIILNKMVVNTLKCRSCSIPTKAIL